MERMRPARSDPANGEKWEAISVVVPAFNSGGMLTELVAGLREVLAECASRFEIVLVNDGSRDDTWPKIESLIASGDDVRGIDLMRNYGQHNALLCGILASRFPVTVTLDDDLQHPPEEIPRLLAKLGEGYDVVYGTPMDEQHELWRTVAARLTKLALSSNMGVETARKVSAFRAFRTELREAFRRYRGPFVSIDVLLTWASTRFASVSVHHRPRPSGASNYTFAKLVAHALNMMTGFSTLPLQLASWVGFGFTLFGLLILAFAVGRYLAGGSLPGFPFLASIIAIFSGAQLFALGIIGEYLARMHFRLMDRPPYVIRTSSGSDDG